MARWARPTLARHCHFRALQPVWLRRQPDILKLRLVAAVIAIPLPFASVVLNDRLHQGNE